jgi:hypothetical protein
MFISCDQRRLPEYEIHDQDHQSGDDEVIGPTCFAMTCDLWHSMFFDLGNDMSWDLAKVVVHLQ